MILAWLYTQDAALDVDEVKDIFQQAFASIWFGETESDGFNHLVLGAQINRSVKPVFCVRMQNICGKQVLCLAKNILKKHCRIIQKLRKN